MAVMLDTCALLSLTGDTRHKLSLQTLKIIQSEDLVAISAGSYFEIAVKANRGKLQLQGFTSAQGY